ncbi:hypothetical protein EMPG_16969, partial [Blastomyces silverae]
ISYNLIINILNSENFIYLYLSIEEFDDSISIHLIIICKFTLTVYIQFHLNHTTFEDLIQ